jgi:hypothetical protein
VSELGVLPEQKAPDGTVWLNIVGGLFIGRTVSGLVRVCVSYSGPPWMEKFAGTWVELQPEHFEKIMKHVFKTS